MIATTLYTAGAILLVFAALHIIAALIQSACTSPDAATSGAFQDTAVTPEAAPQQGEIGLVIDTLFLLALAAMFSVVAILGNADAAKPPVAAILLVSSLFGLVYGVNDGKRKNKAAIKTTMNNYLNVYFLAALSI